MMTGYCCVRPYVFDTIQYNTILTVFCHEDAQKGQFKASEGGKY